jgi:hypothetical protein
MSFVQREVSHCKDRAEKGEVPEIGFLYYRDLHRHLNARDRGKPIYHPAQYPRECFAKMSENYFALREEILCSEAELGKPVPTEAKLEKAVNALLEPAYPHLWPYYRDTIIPKLKAAAEQCQQGLTGLQRRDEVVEPWMTEQTEQALTRAMQADIDALAAARNVPLPPAEFAQELAKGNDAELNAALWRWMKEGQKTHVQDALVEIYCGETDPQDRDTMRAILAENPALHALATRFVTGADAMLHYSNRVLRGCKARFANSTVRSFWPKTAISHKNPRHSIARRSTANDTTIRSSVQNSARLEEIRARQWQTNPRMKNSISITSHAACHRWS